MVLATEEHNLIYRDINAELARQEVKFGDSKDWNHSHDRHFVILGEEVGEVADAINEGKEFHIREELIQVAAVAIAHVRAIDRKNR